MSSLPSQQLTTARRAAGNCPAPSVIGPRASKSEKLPPPKGAKASWRAEAGMPWTSYVSEGFRFDSSGSALSLARSKIRRLGRSAPCP
jgi:hypothetical protein